MCSIVKCIVFQGRGTEISLISDSTLGGLVISVIYDFIMVVWVILWGWGVGRGWFSLIPNFITEVSLNPDFIQRRIPGPQFWFKHIYLPPSFIREVDDLCDP